MHRQKIINWALAGKITEQFALRREVVESIVDRIEDDANKQAHAIFIFDFNEIGSVISQDNSSLREFLGNSSLKDFKLWGAKGQGTINNEQ